MNRQLIVDHLKKNFKLAYPVMLSHLGHVMVGVADNIMVGQLGAIPLGAASLANGIFIIIFTFGIGLSTAITPLVALADGAKNFAKIPKIVSNGLIINLSFSLLFVIFLIAGASLLNFLNQPQEVVDLAIPYLKIISASLIPFMVFQSFKQFADGLSRTKPAMYVIIIANLINILFNYLLIFGKYGFPELGLNGAGVATIFSRTIMALLMLFIMIRGNRNFNFSLFPLQKFSKSVIREINHIGLPTGFQYIFEVGAFSMAVIIIGWIGEEALAAHQIAINLASISYMLAAGIAAAATIRVGNQLGQNDRTNLRMAGFTSYMMGILLMSVAALLFIFGRFFLASLYIDNQVVIDIAAQLLIIAAFFQISDGIQVVGLGALRGMADVKIPSIITLVTYWVIGLPVGYILAFPLNLGARGVWIGLLTGLTVAAILLTFRFQYISKKI